MSSTVPWTTKVGPDLRIKSLKDDVVRRRRKRRGRGRRWRRGRRGRRGKKRRRGRKWRWRSMLEAEVLCTPSKPYIKMHTELPSSLPAAVSKSPPPP